jgi:hypothetical protein
VQDESTASEEYTEEATANADKRPESFRAGAAKDGRPEADPLTPVTWV